MLLQCNINEWLYTFVRWIIWGLTWVNYTHWIVAMSYISCINWVERKYFVNGGDLMVLCSPCSNSWWNMFDLINLLNANIFGREDGVEGMAFVSVLIECRFLCHVSIATNPCRFWPFSNYSSSAVETLYMTLLFLCGARRHWKLR